MRRGDGFRPRALFCAQRRKMRLPPRYSATVPMRCALGTVVFLTFLVLAVLGYEVP